MDPRTQDQHQTETPEETLALTRRLLARSRATLEGMDRRLSGTRDTDTADPPTRDAG